MRIARYAIAFTLVAALGCNNVDNEKTYRSPTGPDTAEAVATVNGVDVIEFRVVGNAVSATIRYTTSIDGTAQTTTGLPFSVTLRSNRERLFINLDVAVQAPAIGALNTFVIAQIFVNGQLFREAYAAGLLPSVSANGTFYHGQQITIGGVQ